MSERRYGWVMVALGAWMTCIAIGGAVAIALAFPPFPKAARVLAPAAT